MRTRVIEQIMEMAGQLNESFAFTASTSTATAQAQSGSSNYTWIDAWGAFIGNNASEFHRIVPNLPLQDLETLCTALTRAQEFSMSRLRGLLLAPSQKKKKTDYGTKVAKAILLPAAVTLVGGQLVNANKLSDPSFQKLLPYTNAGLVLGLFSALAGLVLKEKEADRVSKVLMMTGAAATTASVFAPVVAPLPLPAATTLALVITCIFAVAAVLACREK